MTKSTCGEMIPKLLQAYGVNTVFGIPGVHTIELYRGLPASSILHVTPRHEQGAGFMADGYARASGRPGVCFIITGPGMTNIVTAMGQAMQDSIPMLVISSVNRTEQLAMGEGRLHELPNQLALTERVSAFSHTLLNANNLPKVLARAFAVFNSKRPAPVHIEIPLDILVQDASHLDITPWPLPSPPGLSKTHAMQVADLLIQAKRPLIIIGGGCKMAGPALTKLVDIIGAPVVNTNNAKGVIDAGHPLSLGCTPSHPVIREEIEKHADLVLAIGTEMSETDFDFFFIGDMQINGKLIRVDIDAEQLARNQRPDLALMSDANLAITAITEVLSEHNITRQDTTGGVLRCVELKQKTIELKNDSYAAIFETINTVLPGCIVVGDSTQPTYYAQAYHETSQPNRYFHSATGYGTLGYAFPAAVGAKLAKPNLKVVGLIGDGGGQFTLNEIISAVEANVAVIYLVWNNKGHGEIRRFMEDNNVEKIGVDIHSPDYIKLAEAMNCPAMRVHSVEQLKTSLQYAKDLDTPYLIEIIEGDVVNGYAFQ